ncbi:hypothetical protein QTP70_032485 [Hemibagrus guttatus]|uniref:Uncharacterized protein n=1 Tax=Hemibagrus guttatus TaxID=175788 RepID=A0AAE0R0L6_9TELE|nr:hypothetical protein QTP70_032485 [Hemibagrus guttatus]
MRREATKFYTDLYSAEDCDPSCMEELLGELPKLSPEQSSMLGAELGGVVGKVLCQLSQWTWVLPQLSYRGRVLVTNNLIASLLWHSVHRPRTFRAVDQGGSEEDSKLFLGLDSTGLVPLFFTCCCRKVANA